MTGLARVKGKPEFGLDFQGVSRDQLRIQVFIFSFSPSNVSSTSPVNGALLDPHETCYIRVAEFFGAPNVDLKRGHLTLYILARQVRPSSQGYYLTNSNQDPCQAPLEVSFTQASFAHCSWPHKNLKLDKNEIEKNL